MVSSTGGDDVRRAEFTESSGDKMIKMLSDKALKYDKTTVEEGRLVGPQSHAENTRETLGERASGLHVLRMLTRSDLLLLRICILYSRLYI